MACDIVVGSLSSLAPLVSLNLPPEEGEEKENLVCIIIAVADAYVSDNPNHDQPLPSGFDLLLPPAVSPLYTRLPDHLLPFHHDDVYGPVDLFNRY